MVEDAGLFVSFDIINRNGTHQIAKVKDSLTLPKPQPQKSASVNK